MSRMMKWLGLDRLVGELDWDKINAHMTEMVEDFHRAIDAQELA